MNYTSPNIFPAKSITIFLGGVTAWFGRTDELQSKNQIIFQIEVLYVYIITISSIPLPIDILHNCHGTNPRSLPKIVLGLEFFIDFNITIQTGAQSKFCTNIQTLAGKSLSYLLRRIETCFLFCHTRCIIVLSVFSVHVINALGAVCFQFTRC